jgi:hypothetical protein
MDRIMANDKALLVAISMLGLAAGASAQDIDKQARVLELIGSTADRICSIVTIEGSTDSAKIEGKVQTQLDSLMGKLTGIGVSMGAEYDAKRWSGIIQKDLAQAVKDNAQCKSNVFNKLVPMIPEGSRGLAAEQSCQSIAGNWILENRTTNTSAPSD